MSGIALTEFKIDGTPETCPKCKEEMTEGLEHKVDGVAKKQFDRFHEHCLSYENYTHSCPICFQKVETIKGEPVLSDEKRSRDVVNAATFGAPKWVRELLDGHTISEDARMLAFVRAAENGSVEILELLSEGHEIPEECRGTAVIMAAARGRIMILENLLDGHTISSEDLEIAIQRAVEPEARKLLERRRSSSSGCQIT